MQRISVILMLALFLLSCSGKKKTAEGLFQLLPSDSTGIHFRNDISNTKDFNIFSYRNFYNGGGVAIGDINNDGLPDIFFTANQGSNKLYLNKGSLKFEDISAKAGFTDKADWSTGVTMVDINHDGWLDIYVCNAGYVNRQAPQNRLFINNHDLTFSDSTEKYGLSNYGGYCTHAAFFDYDLDGDLDCYILNNSFIPVNTLNYANKRDLPAKDWPVADFLKGGGDKLLRNDDGHFTDVTRQAGIYSSLIGFGLGVTVADINGDHYPDLYISNDFFERDYLYINQKNGTYKEELEDWIQHTSFASMGADIADINNDGYPDIFTTDMLPDDDYRLRTTSTFDNYDVFNLKIKSGFYYQYMQNTLQLNNRNGKFSEIANYAGVNASDWSWGALMFDADNDGYNDIYVCNGIKNDVTDQDFINFFADEVNQRMVMTGKKTEVDSIINKMPSRPIVNKAFRNQGNLKFTDEGKNWGFTQPSFSNGAAYADLDNDGDLDLVVNNVNSEAFVYRNQTREKSAAHYIAVSLQQEGKNPFAIGSTISLYSGTEILSREIMPSRGFQSSVDYKTVIGLGSRTSIDSMIIIWPDRTFTVYHHPAIDKSYTIQKDNNRPVTDSTAQETQALFSLLQNDFDAHEEDDYVDYYNERLVPEMLSKDGPKMAVADVNGDGLDDIYIGGTSKKQGQLYIQTNIGFEKKEIKDFILTKNFEDVAVLFFDADKDGDQDLFIGSGGNNAPAYGPELSHRLYLNDGKGNFSYAPNSFPQNHANISCVAANDFDGDGDIDLFVGSHCLTQQYGITPGSYLLLNDGKGHFSNIAEKNPALANAGMITAAVWADINNDQKKELIITGEWMGTKIFSYQSNGQFEELPSVLADMNGCWQSIEAADLDGDGDTDLVLGNIGENFYLHPDKDHPVKMFMNDFDNNGVVDKIITRTVNGKDVPVFMKRELEEQIPSLKKKNLQFKEFGHQDVIDLFGEEAVRKSQEKKINYCSSVIAVNDGKGNFSVQPLPAEVQFSSANAIKIADFNNDNKPDLVIAGNKFDFLPQFGRLDANTGLVLINRGAMKFTVLTAKETGITIRGQVRDVKEIRIKNNSCLLFTQNNDKPVLYTMPGK